jgi:hypothetical protein
MTVELMRNGEVYLVKGDNEYLIRGPGWVTPCGPSRTVAEYKFRLATDKDYADRVVNMVDTSEAVNGAVRCSVTSSKEPWA